MKPTPQVSWIWVWIPTREYELSGRKVSLESGTFSGHEQDDRTFEEKLDEVKRHQVMGRETHQLSKDGNLKLVQFYVKNLVKIYTTMPITLLDGVASYQESCLRQVDHFTV